MRDQLERTQAIAEKLDAMCQLASAEAARLRVEFGAQEDDRQHLIRWGSEGSAPVHLRPCLGVA